jgi:hypothetical protein
MSIYYYYAIMNLVRELIFKAREVSISAPEYGGRALSMLLVSRFLM